MTGANGDGPRNPGGPDPAADTADSLLHDINNVTGRLLSTLYLSLSDLEADHPVRGRLEIANEASLELRQLTQRLETVLGKKT